MKTFVLNKWTIAGLIFLFSASVFLLTWAPIYMGYEKETAISAVNFSQGTYQIFRAGLSTILLYQPFIWLSNLFSAAAQEKLLTLVPLFYSALMVAIVFLISEKLTEKISVSVGVSILVAVASLVWPYGRIGMEYPAEFFLCLLLLALLRWREDHASPLWIGAALVGAVLCKSYGILFTIPVFAFVAVTLWERKQLKKIFSLSLLLKIFGFSALGLMVVAYINYHLYGQWQGIYYLKQEFQVWSWWEGFYGVFFSFGKSLFLYSPLLIPAAIYWPKFFRRYPSVAAFTLSTMVVLMIITLPFSFWSDETLSVRKLVPIIPLLHLPLLMMENLRRFRKYVLVGLIIIGIYIQGINSLYPYWRQLEFIRPYNLDTLSTIRYNPRLSHLALHNDFFVSFVREKITGNAGTFSYEERSWMRDGTFPRTGNPILTDIKVKLYQFNKPEIYILGQSPKSHRMLFTVFSCILVVVSGTALYVIARGQKNN